LHWSRMTLYRKLAKYGIAQRGETAKGLQTSDSSDDRPR